MCSRKVGGRKVVMQMWDTAGQERWVGMIGGWVEKGGRNVGVG